MPSSFRPLRFLLPLIVTGAFPATLGLAQQTQTVPSPKNPGYSSSNPGTSSSGSSNAGQSQLQSPRLSVPSEQKAAAGKASLMDPAGPAVSLETSEAMFEVAVALNACGYDQGVDESNPVRKQVRDAVNQGTVDSARARDDRDKLCLFIDQHRLDNPDRTLAQYVSLALYLSPPPELTPSVDQEDLPPDASGVVQILPLLRKFADDLDLHVIWLQNRPAYDDIVTQLHAPLTQMIVSTNYYLKVPASVSNSRRFLVVIEPMFSPEETNARVYGPDYVVVASPKDGQIPMHLVRHAYLHYEIEPLLYQREDSMDRLLPLLKIVDDAPLQFTFKSDIVALVIESMIRAIEARTMDTGIKLEKTPPGLSHSEAEPYERARTVALEKIADIRQQSVDHSMAQGFVLTQYFYNQLLQFEKSPESMDEAVGPMVYGMDIATEMHRAKQIDFDQQGEADLMSHSPAQPQGLDLAEIKLMKGDIAGADAMARAALASHSGDPGQAEFIVARADLMSGRKDDAITALKETLTASKDPRTLAWSHIYLGRIFDVEEQRDQAVAEYKAALTVRDGQPDTKAAAEKGLQKPFALPPEAQAGEDGQNAPQGQAPAGQAPETPQPAAPNPGSQPPAPQPKPQ